MNKNKIYLIALLASSLCISLWIPPRNLSAQEIYTERDTLKKTLDNGMVVVIHDTRRAPISAIELVVETGSATEGRFSGSGISHLAEHMMFKRGGDRERADTKDRIKALGADINAFTSYDYTAYKITVESTHTGEALEILRDMVAPHPFDLAELKNEKEVILDEIRKNRDDPSRLASDISWRTAFKEHPYSHPIIGHKELLARAGKDELEEYCRERYLPNNMILAVAGDIDKERILKEAEDIFGSLERGFAAKQSAVSEPQQTSPRTHTEYRPVSLAHVAVSCVSASIDDAALYPLDVIATALGEGGDCILTRELRDKKGLVYSAECGNYTLRDSGLFCVHLTAEAEKAREAVSAVLEELDKIKSEGISGDELDRAKNIARMRFLGALETAEGRASDISSSEAMANDYNFSRVYLERLMAVTPEDVKRAAADYFKRPRINTVYVLPEEENVPEKPEAPRQGEREAAKHVLPNGARIIISEDRSIPVCSVSALFLGGVRSEDASNNGISRLVSKLLLCGTKTRSEKDIKSAIESKGGTLRSISGNNSFGLLLNVPEEEWKAALEIISDAVIDPVFPEEKIDREKRLARGAIKKRADDIITAGLMTFRENFFDGHPYGMDAMGSEEGLEGIGRDAIVNYHKSLCVPSNMVLAVIGDVDAEEALEEIKKRIEPFETAEPKIPKPAIPEFSRAPDKRSAEKQMNTEQSLFIAGFPSPKLADGDRYIFEVIDSVMSGIGGRMFINIRDNMGMTYIIGSSAMPGLDPGCHIFYALSERRNIEAVKKAVMREIAILKTKPVPDEELEAAKKKLIASRAAALQENGAFGLKLALDELYGLGYDNYKRYASRINGVTAAHIKRAVNQYFDEKKGLAVTIYGGAR